MTSVSERKAEAGRLSWGREWVVGCTKKLKDEYFTSINVLAKTLLPL